MNLRDIHLSTRITVAALVLVTAGATGLVFMEEARLRDTFVIDRRADLETAMETEKLRLQQSIGKMRRDAVFLSTTPPTSGIIRALRNHGFDARYNTTTATWKERLEQIFAAFAVAHPEYYQLRFIGVADGGRELVRVNQRNGKVSVTPSERLQQKGDRDYFKGGLALREGEVFLSEIDLNEDFGVIEHPYIPALRASTPVFTPEGELFGVIVLNQDVGKLLESVTIGVPPQVRAYVSNQDGQYLIHTDRKRSFGFLLGREDKVTTEFPGLAAMLDARFADHLPLQVFSTAQGVQYLAADRVHFDPHDPARFLLLSYSLPAAAVVHGISAIPHGYLIGVLLAMLLTGVIVFLILQRMFAPLERIVAAAEQITAGARDVALPEGGAGEIARLSRSIGAMMGKLMRREQKIQRINEELEQQQHALFENMLDGYAYQQMLFGADGKACDYVFLNVNKAFFRLTGLQDVIDKKGSEVIPGIHESNPELLEIYGRVAQTGEPARFEVYVEPLQRWYTVTAYSPKQGYFVTLFDDISGRKRVERDLRVAAITFDSHDAVVITDVNSNILRVNRAFTEITGYSVEEVLGKNPKILSAGRQPPEFYLQMWQQLVEKGRWDGEIWDRRKNGEIYPKWLTITAVKDETGEVSEYVGIFLDITARKKTEEEMHNLAFYDALTKLPNRRLLLDRLGLALALSERNRNYGAVMFLDMDMFKTLNDTMGHDCGDLMLVEVARRIQSCVREMDTVARFGGDEFVVLVEEIGENEDEVSQRVAAIAEKIRVALSRPYQIKGYEYHSSPSIGVSLYLGNRETVDDLLKHADMAMYQVKDSGRNAVRFFDPVMQQRVEAHAALESDMRKAVPGEQLRLYYQIQVDGDQRPLGAEALVRWQHPQRGLVPPVQFIPVAEESSLILEIGQWVLDTACRQLALWKGDERMRGLTLAVNVSAQQFHLHDFVQRVAAVVHKHSVDATRLKLELTEGVVLKDIDDVVAKMHALRELGVNLSMDDFGTGYSSLAYLKKLPLDQIKIDQSFVRDVTSDPNDAVMVRTIIDMGRNFKLEVIAEGVETEQHFAFLRQYGCMAYQGYLFSKPVPVEQFEALVEELQGM